MFSQAGGVSDHIGTAPAAVTWWESERGNGELGRGWGEVHGARGRGGGPQDTSASQ